MYDANDRLLSETIYHHDDDLDRTESFVMDLFGNRTDRTVDYVDPTATDQAFAYTYDDNDRLITETLDENNDGSTDKTTTYSWNGTQQTSKSVSEGTQVVNAQSFEYDLQGRLASVVTDPSSGDSTKVTYSYDSSGIRISSSQFTDANNNGTFEASELDATVEYLVDHRNHTVYAQTIVETTKDSNDVITQRIAYTFGTDEITQTVTEYVAGVAQTPVVHTFGHDAHGSVRVLLDAAGAIAQAYIYAAYGEILAVANSTGSIQTSNFTLQTSLLYSGESFDSRIGQQYLRARWYDMAAGRFSRLDPYFGNHRDPLSFNKYNYVHSNPIAGIDPTGLQFTLAGLTSAIGNRFGANAINGGTQLRTYYRVFKVLDQIQDIFQTITDVYDLLNLDISDITQSLDGINLFQAIPSRKEELNIDLPKKVTKKLHKLLYKYRKLAGVKKAQELIGEIARKRPENC